MAGNTIKINELNSKQNTSDEFFAFAGNDGVAFKNEFSKVQDRPKLASNNRGQFTLTTGFDWTGDLSGYANSVLKIRDNFNLNSETISLPPNVKLVNDGGVISNGTFNCNNTRIDANDSVFFGLDLFFNGDLKLVNKNYNPIIFGAVGDGDNDDTLFLQKCIDEFNGIVGDLNYNITSPLVVKNNTFISGFSSNKNITITTKTDITAITSLIGDAVNDNLKNVRIKYLFLTNTLTTEKIKYDIHLFNPVGCELQNVHVKSAHSDSYYSDTNVGGVHFEKNEFGLRSYLNKFIDCWMQNNSLRLTGITDSSITGGYYWGHVREFAIGFFGSNSGANEINGVLGIVTSQYKGGIYFGSAGINQMRIINNEFDGNPLHVGGIGIYMDRTMLSTVIVSNTIWGCGSHGIYAKDPVALTVSGNTFWKNNRSDIGSDDIKIEGENFNPSGNSISGNTHKIDDLRVNKGYVYNEVGSSPLNYPVRNTLVGNSVDTENYLPSLINTAYQDDRGVKSSGNTWDAFQSNVSEKGTVTPNGGTLVLDLKGTSNSTFIGFVHVSLVRSDFPAQSRSASYFLTCKGGVGTLTQLGFGDGASGGVPLSVSISGTNTLTLTNVSTDSGQIATGLIQFSGTINRLA